MGRVGAPTELANKFYGYVCDDGQLFVSRDLQRHRIELWGLDRQAKLIRCFEDKKTFDGLAMRRELFAMFKEISTGDVRTIVVERLFALSPDVLTQEAILALFKRLRINVFSCCEPNLASHEACRRSIRSVLARFDLVDETFRRRLYKRSRSRLPFGTYPHERDTLERIFELASHGIPLRGIAAMMNDENLPTRSGLPWGQSTVRRILAGQSSALKRVRQRLGVVV